MEEEDVELEGEESFHFFDIDIDYEFDAPRYFELGRVEFPLEAQQAELWFETAGNYPPSPMIVKISFVKKGKPENIDELFKFRDVDSLNAQMGVYAFPGSSLLCGSLAGTAYNTFEGTCSTNPSFMKPTTSQLARQNLMQRSPRWFQKPLYAQSRSSEDSIHCSLHAAKRQKVPGGLICKVVGMAQQSELLHKSSKKECFVNCNSHLTKLRLTIPREPVLGTAQRAKNFRAQRSNHPEGKETSTSTFKALPLNRKILEAPSLSFPKKSTPKLPEFQEFKLKTFDRAVQRSLAATTSLITDNLGYSSTVKDCWAGSKKSEYHSSSLSKRVIDDKKARGSIRKLKGLNLNEKIINFSETKRIQQQNPLSELFNKLSLSSEAQQVNVTWTDFPVPDHVTTKMICRK